MHCFIQSIIAIVTICIGIGSILSVIWGYNQLNYDYETFINTTMTTISYGGNNITGYVLQQYPANGILYIANITGFNSKHSAQLRWPLHSTQRGWYEISNPTVWSFSVHYGKYMFIMSGVGLLLTILLLILFTCSCFKCMRRKKETTNTFGVNYQYI